jgi:hypothetical protein
LLASCIRVPHSEWTVIEQAKLKHQALTPPSLLLTCLRR